MEFTLGRKVKVQHEKGDAQALCNGAVHFIRYKETGATYLGRLCDCLPLKGGSYDNVPVSRAGDEPVSENVPGKSTADVQMEWALV